MSYARNTYVVDPHRIQLTCNDSIPSWVKEIKIMLVDVSTDGTDSLVITIGDSGGLETSGYKGGAALLAEGASATVSNLTAAWQITDLVARAYIS